MHIICIVIELYIVICVVRVLLSWFPTDESTILGSIGTITYTLSEPTFNTVRRMIPQMGDLPLDVAPVIVILGLQLIQRILCSYL